MILSAVIRGQNLSSTLSGFIPTARPIIFSITGVRKRDGYTGHFFDQIRAEIVLYFTFTRGEEYLTGILHFSLRF